MDMQLEEGEISDCSDEDNINPYIPLKRPVAHFEPVQTSKNNSPTPDEDAINPYVPLERPLVSFKQQEPMHPSFDSDTPSMELDPSSSKERKPPGLQSSDSESEDDEINAKKLKISSPVKNKYTIWNKDPDGDLTDILNQVGMDEMPDPENSRNVENYPLPFKRSDNKINGKFIRPRRRKIPQRPINKDEEHTKKFARILDSLDVNESNTFEDVAEDITKKLKERNQDLILKIVVVLGKDKAIQIYEKTRVIEKMGGMLINNGSRKRTSGGVFIFLVRSDKEIPDDKLMAIFECDEQPQKNVCSLLNSLKKKRKRKKMKKHNIEKNSSELSNPPPSPDVPDAFPRDDTLDFLF